VKIIGRFLILFCFPISVFAWNIVGHKVVAQIAYQQLNPIAKEKVDSLVASMHQQYPMINSFADIACWPDKLREQKIDVYKHWHYADFSFSKDGTPLKDLLTTDNAIWAFNSIQIIVHNARANPYERARFLAFLAHIVGDLHQPLHTVSFISATLPDGDKGGNDYFVRYQHARISLHKLWDRGVDNFVGDNSSTHADQIANTLMTLYPQSYFAQRVNHLEAERWKEEGMSLAKEVVYATPYNQEISAEYIQNARLFAGQQVALAGYRLGNLLNQLLI
jgi:hypothetical protein